MTGVVTFNRKAILDKILTRLESATEAASAEGADAAREEAPLGKGNRAATGSNPRYFAVKLQTTHAFKRANNTKRSAKARRGLERLVELRTLTRAELTTLRPSEGGLTPEDVKFFQFSNGSRRGQTPDVIDVQSARGPGGLAVKGATTHYTPGRLKKGIHPIEVTREGLMVKGGFASEAPYSNVVEHGFHHKGGTVVAAHHFMKPAAEGLRGAWNHGQFIKE